MLTVFAVLIICVRDLNHVRSVNVVDVNLAILVVVKVHDVYVLHVNNHGHMPVPCLRTRASKYTQTKTHTSNHVYTPMRAFLSILADAAGYINIAYNRLELGLWIWKYNMHAYMHTRRALDRGADLRKRQISSTVPNESMEILWGNFDICRKVIKFAATFLFLLNQNVTTVLMNLSTNIKITPHLGKHVTTFL